MTIEAWEREASSAAGAATGGDSETSVFCMEEAFGESPDDVPGISESPTADLISAEASPQAEPAAAADSAEFGVNDLQAHLSNAGPELLSASAVIPTGEVKPHNNLPTSDKECHPGKELLCEITEEIKQLRPESAAPSAVAEADSVVNSETTLEVGSTAAETELKKETLAADRNLESSLETESRPQPHTPGVANGRTSTLVSANTFPGLTALPPVMAESDNNVECPVSANEGLDEPVGSEGRSTGSLSEQSTPVKVVETPNIAVPEDSISGKDTAEDIVASAKARPEGERSAGPVNHEAENAEREVLAEEPCVTQPREPAEIDFEAVKEDTKASGGSECATPRVDTPAEHAGLVAPVKPAEPAEPARPAERGAEPSELSDTTESAPKSPLGSTVQHVLSDPEELRHEPAKPKDLPESADPVGPVEETAPESVGYTGGRAEPARTVKPVDVADEPCKSEELAELPDECASPEESSEPNLDDPKRVFLFVSLAGGVRGFMSKYNRAVTILESYDIAYTPVEVTMNDRARRLWKFQGINKNKVLPAVFRDGELKCDYPALVEANEIEDVEDVIFDD